MFRFDPGIVPLFLGAFTLFFASCRTLESPSRAAPLRVIFVDVGQGDAVLLRSPSGRAYLYDLGDREVPLAAALASQGIDTLEAVLVSHADRDHFGAHGALREVVVKQWYLPETVEPDPAWERFVRELDASRAD